VFYALFNQYLRQKLNRLKFGLQRLGAERIDETFDPEIAIDHADCMNVE